MKQTNSFGNGKFAFMVNVHKIYSKLKHILNVNIKNTGQQQEHIMQIENITY